MGLNVMCLVTVERVDCSSDSFTTSSLGEREIKFVVYIYFAALRSTVLVSRLNILESEAEAGEIAGGNTDLLKPSFILAVFQHPGEEGETCMEKNKAKGQYAA